MKKSPVHSMQFTAEKLKLSFLILCCITINASFVGCDYFFPPLTGDKITVEDAERFLSRNKDNPDVVLIDIRPKNQFDSIRIENSVNIDFSKTDFPELTAKLDPEKRYILVDENGRKGAMAFELMKEQRFPKVHYITGGITEWVKAGYKTLK